MNKIHKNYDYVFKEALSIYKDKVLDFLGLTNIAPITEPLRTETVEIEIKSEFRDLTFATTDGRGLHLEEEIDLSLDDLKRFGSYNLGLSRAYNREFMTVIFVKNPTTLTELSTEQLIFKPIVVQCSTIDADVMLAKLKQDVDDGKPINELELVYLPLFNSIKFSPTELFLESTGLIKNLQTDDDSKRKLYALSAVLASKVVDRATIEELFEEVKMMGNVILEVAEEFGAKRQQEETVKKMLLKDCKLSDIIEFTGIDVDRLSEIREDLRAKAI